MKTLHARRRDPGLSEEQVAQINREIQQEEIAHRKHLTSLNELAKIFVSQANTGKKTHTALKKRKSNPTLSSTPAPCKKKAPSAQSKATTNVRDPNTSSLEIDGAHSVIDETDDIDYDDFYEENESIDVPPTDIESEDEL